MGSLFGSTNNNPLTASTLTPANQGGGGGLFGNSTANNPRGPGGDAEDFIELQKRIEEIAAAWNSQSPDCRFQASLNHPR